MNNLRWQHNVLIRNSGVKEFWKQHFTPSSKLLYVLGRGFDPRMTLGIENVKETMPDINIECVLIEFDEGRHSPSTKYKDLVNSNHTKLKSIVDTINLQKISAWSKSEGKKIRVGDRQAAELIGTILQGKDYTDIIVDISALPRSIFFAIIGKMLTIVDDEITQGKPGPNFFVLAAENADIDFKIVEEELDEDLGYQHGLAGNIDSYADSQPIIWLPLLGEGKKTHLDKANQFIKPSEICPILPFPSKNPRRSDNIFMEHQEMLFDVLRVEAQNIMYVPEQNPFEVYKKLISTIENYDNSLSALKGCKAVLSTFCSKLLSIGALLAAYELTYPQKQQGSTLDVGVLHVDSQGYNINDPKSLESLRDKSELFVIWLTGIPYQ